VNCLKKDVVQGPETDRLQTNYISAIDFSMALLKCNMKLVPNAATSIQPTCTTKDKKAHHDHLFSDMSKTTDPEVQSHSSAAGFDIMECHPKWNRKKMKDDHIMDAVGEMDDHPGKSAGAGKP